MPETTTTAPLYPRPASEGYGAKGRCKEARRNVRNALGTSADPAPNLAQALDAAESLRRIIDLQSGGRYGLAIVRPTFEGETPQTRHREVHEGWAGSERERFTGTVPETSSQVHEPVTETRRRERYLRDRRNDA